MSGATITIATVEDRLFNRLGRKADAHLAKRTEQSRKEFQLWLKTYEKFVDRPDTMYCRSMIAAAVEDVAVSKWPAIIDSMS